MAQKITVQIDAALVQKMRAKAIADGLPNARSIPDQELLSALLLAALGEEPEITVIEPAAGIVRVTSEAGLNLRREPVSGEVIRILADHEELTLLDRQGDWLQVRTADGVAGWVSADYVSEEQLPPRDNVRGIHGSAGVVAPPRHLWGAWVSELRAMRIAWYKQLDAGDPNDIGHNSAFAWSRRLKRNGIEPIIRYFQGQMFPGRLSPPQGLSGPRYGWSRP